MGYYNILQLRSFETSRTLAAQFLVNSRSYVQILRNSIRNYQLLRYLIARYFGLERRCLLQLVVESTTFYWILQRFTTSSDFVRTSKTIAAQFLVNSRSQILQDSMSNNKLLRLRTFTRIYNIVWHITTFHNFVGLCRNFKNSSGVVSCKFSQLDTTRFYEKLATSMICYGTDMSRLKGVICCSLLQNLQYSVGYYNISQFRRNLSQLRKQQRRSYL